MTSKMTIENNQLNHKTSNGKDKNDVDGWQDGNNIVDENDENQEFNLYDNHKEQNAKQNTGRRQNQRYNNATNNQGDALETSRTHRGQNAEEIADKQGNEEDNNRVSMINSSNNSILSADNVKKFYVHKNGDTFTNARQFVWNKRQLRTFDSFLEQLTTMLKPRTGAVRGIHTPQNGTRLTQYEQLESFRNYVAVSTGERLQRIDYLNLTPQNETGIKRRRDHVSSGTAYSEPKKRLKKKKVRKIYPVLHSRIQVSGRIKHELQKKGKLIFIYRNGDEYSRPVGIQIKPIAQYDFNLIFKAIEDRVILLHNRPIRKLFTMDGRRIMNPEELEEKQHYVAASTELFQPRIYGRELPNVVTGKIDSKLGGVKYLSQMPTPPYGKIRTNPDTQRSTYRSENGVKHSSDNSGPDQPLTSRRYEVPGLNHIRESRNRHPGGPSNQKSRSPNSQRDVINGEEDEQILMKPKRHQRSSTNTQEVQRLTVNPRESSYNHQGPQRPPVGKQEEPNNPPVTQRSTISNQPQKSTKNQQGVSNNPQEPIKTSGARHTGDQRNDQEEKFHWSTSDENDSQLNRTVKQNGDQIDYDRDDGGVFKAKNSDPDNHKAAQIKEDRDTRVELAQEIRKPETVDEEEYEHQQHTYFKF